MGFLFNKAKKGLEEAIELEQQNNITTPSMVPSLVMMNDGVNICATACSSCWDTKLPDDYFERAKYIGRRTKTGHTSIIEHSNVVFYLFVPVERMVDLVEFLDLKNYLHSCVKPASNGSGFHMLIGGYWRAFSDLYLNAYDFKLNSVMVTITKAIQQYIPSDGMRDIIDYGILNEEDYVNVDCSQLAQRYQLVYNERIDEDLNIVSCDNIEQLKEDLKSVCDEPYLFTTKDLLKFCTITVEFNHMSRIITQQLTRHRNGITQESQRYVDYSGAPFNSPAKFKDRYNPKRLYEFKFGGQTFKMNLQNLGDNMNKIYEQLKDKSKYGNEALLSEDARGYLAQNTQCGRIYMTFNYYTFIKFLQLREDAHAQAEIKSYADRLGAWFRNNVINGGNPANAGLYDALIPNEIAVKTADNNYFMQTITIDPGFGNEPWRDGNEVGEALSDEEYAKIYEESIKKEDEESSNQESNS